MEITKPLDALNVSKGKIVLAEFKSGTQFQGVLKAFDIHLNLVFDDAQEIIDGEVKRKLGRVLIRGDQVKFISPPK
jgi:small nuclear ribonucleoprotein